MKLTSLAIRKRTVTYFSAILLFVAGIASYFVLGRLEDPDFTVKTALVMTAYPGASPQEVELEVTDRIEKAIQELPELDCMYSLSRAGLSIISVDIKEKYWFDRLPQVWDSIRKKINDILPTLPPGVGKPDVRDDFSFVYGFVLAVTGDGYSYGQLEEYADFLKKELSLLEGVSRVEIGGVQEKVIYLDVAEDQLSELGLTAENFLTTLSKQNMVVDSGSIDFMEERFRITQTGAFETPEDIENLIIHGYSQGKSINGEQGVASHTDGLIRVRDLASVNPGYLDPPKTLMRFNGQPALTVALANIAGGNIVETGKAIDKRLDELLSQVPIGIEVHRIAWQSDLVNKSVNDFMVNFIEAVAIVLIVLVVSMGWRLGLIIGIDLILTILGTFICMAMLDIELHRVSLGALVITLGMIVDNAIVVADGYAVRLQSGMDRIKAAIESTSRLSWPLFGATVVAIMAFYPIIASKENVGEFCSSLFIVVAISLMLSWLIAMMFTPLQCIDLIPQPKSGKKGETIYSGTIYYTFRALLVRLIHNKWLTLGTVFVLLIASLLGFGSVKRMFFPDSTRTQFMVDYWAPEGTRIQQVSADLKPIESKLLKDPRVANVSAFIGMGPPRFYLPIDPELPYQSYAQLIVNTHTVDDVCALLTEVEPWLQENIPQALTRVRKYGVGPNDTWPFEARFIGTGETDLVFLRSLGEKGKDILKNTTLAKDIRTDMRQRSKKVVVDYAQERARWAGISREDIGQTTKRAFDGLQVGLYREGDDLYPILLRKAENERHKVANSFDVLQVKPAVSTNTIPLSQVTKDIRIEWEDPIIVRYNRRRSITVQSSPNGVTFPTLRKSVIKEFKQLESTLPSGWELFWDGEYKSSKDAQKALIPGIIPAGVIMIFIIMVLLNTIRPTLIIILTIPLAIIGITTGLLITGIPFGFMAILGAISLSGMMIKNAIVLLDQISKEEEMSKSPHQIVVDSAVSRFRPVVLASLTTVLGVTPLLQDVFWESMSVTIIAGLSFGTILTLVIVPVLYTVFFRIQSKAVN